LNVSYRKVFRVLGGAHNLGRAVNPLYREPMPVLVGEIGRGTLPRFSRKRSVANAHRPLNSLRMATGSMARRISSAVGNISMALLAVPAPTPPVRDQAAAHDLASPQ